MTRLDATSIVDIWERGRNLSSLQRALLILNVTAPEAPVDPARLPIGLRDAQLYRLRVEAFGERFDAFATCPSCTHALEFDMSEQVANVLLNVQWEHFEPVHMEVGGRRITVRAPATADLIEAIEASIERDERLTLVASCVMSDDQEPDTVVADPAVLDRLETALKEADPGAEVLLSLSCPECTHTWRALFDIATFLWDDIERTSRDLLEAVHLIASRYGWSEERILSMTTHRRNVYLERILA